MSKLQGFSLFELVLAVGAVGLALTVSLPAYQDYHYREQIRQLTQRIHHDQQRVMAYQQRHQHWPRDAQRLFSPSEGAPYLQQAPRLLQHPQALHYQVELGHGVHGVLQLEATWVDGQLQGWRCRPLGSTPGFEHYLPALCQAG